MDENKFVQLLEHVLTPDTATLKSATQVLRSDYYSQPESLPALINVLRSHPNDQLRQLAAVEARSLIPKFWAPPSDKPCHYSPDLRNQLRQSLLRSTMAEPNSLVRHSSARVISAIAKLDIPDGEWADLPQFLAQAASSYKAGDREVGVYILYTLLESLEDMVADRTRDFFQLFSRTINDGESISVRLNTLLALGKMAEFLNPEEDTYELSAFREALPHMLNVLKDLVQMNDEQKADSAFEVFQTLLIVDPALTANHFRLMVEFMMELASAKNVADDYRTKAISFLMSCLRYKKLKMQALKFGEPLTLRALEIVTEFKEMEDPDDMSPSRSALSLIDYLSASLPPSMVVVPLLKAIPQYTSSPNPDYRKAAVLALGMCVEGAPDFVATQIKSILPVVLNLLQDPELKVRQAALHTIARLADDLPEEIGKEHARIVPAFIGLLDSSDGLDIWKAACNAVDAVFVGVEQADVERYLPELIPRLFRMFQRDDLKLKAAAVAAIGSTASSAKNLFMPYFQETMSALSPLVTLKHSEEELDLRGVIMDAMTGISESVGATAFTPYVRPLMEAAQEALKLGHPRLKETSFMFFSAMARVYEEEFTHFLPGVVSALFESLDQEETDADEAVEAVRQVITAQASGGVVVIGDEDAQISGVVEDEEEDDEDVWDELNTVNAVAMEKEVAAEVMGEILSHCRNGYLPYLERTVDVLTQKIQHPYEGVRKAAVGTLWRAYATLWQLREDQGAMTKWQPGIPLKVQPTEELVKFGSMVMQPTISLLKDEHDRSTATDICRNLSETLKLCGPAVIANPEDMLEIATQIALILKKQHTCQIDLEEDDVDNMPELSESAEYDWLLVDTAMDVCLGLAAALGSQYGELWKMFGNHILKYASSSEAIERSTAVGVIADSIKYSESGITQHTTQLMKVLLHRLSDEDPETKSNAAYAIGLLCLKSENRQETAKNYHNILRKLEPLLHQRKHRMMDNACGCIARMIVANPEAVPLQEVLPGLVRSLPLTEDYEENAPVYEMLVQLYKNGNELVFSLTPQLVPAFASVLSPPEEQLTLETRAQLVELIKFIHQKEPSVLANHQNLVQTALNG